jgi:hypothetical protein
MFQLFGIVKENGKKELIIERPEYAIDETNTTSSNDKSAAFPSSLNNTKKRSPEFIMTTQI